MAAQIPVVVAGALGRMGAEVIRAVIGSEDCSLVGAVDNTPGKEGADVGLELGLGELEVAFDHRQQTETGEEDELAKAAAPGAFLR